MLGLCSAVSAGCSTKATRLWGLTRPCSDIIYRFNYFLGQFKHQWIHKTSVTTQRVFSPPLRGSPPPPTNHPYVFTCGTGEKLSKMAGNSASKPSNRAPAELPCITIDWWRSWQTRHHASSRYTVINISKRDFSVFINARIRPLFANPVTNKILLGVLASGN